MPALTSPTPRRRWTLADCFAVCVAIVLGSILGIILALAVITVWTN